MKNGDITKSGRLNYRDLQKINQDPYEGLSPKFRKFAEDLDRRTAPISVYDASLHQEQLVESPLSGTSTPWGESIFDNSTATEEQFHNLASIRAENQPWYSQAAAGVAKGAVLAATTFVDGTLGLLYGIGQGVANTLDDDENTNFISGLWDNPITQLMDEINKKSEEVLPNYYTTEQQMAPWYSWENIGTTNFIFDKIIKNAGFMVGAYYSGAMFTKPITWGAKLIGAASVLSKGMKGVKVTQKAIAAGQRAMQMSQATRATKALVGSFIAAVGEGTVEAVTNTNDWVVSTTNDIETKSQQDSEQAYIDFIKEGGSIDENGGLIGSIEARNKLTKRLGVIEEGKKAALAKIEADRIGMGNADLLMNIPILWLGDLFTFGKVYAGGWKAARNTQKTTTRATKEAIKAAKDRVAAGDTNALKDLKEIVKRAKQTGYQGLTAEEKALVEEVPDYILGRKTGATLKALGEPLKEGNEEMTQASAASAAGLYYKDDLDNIYNAKVHPEAKQKTLSMLGSIWEGMKEHYGDINAWEEGFIGALTGMLGSPTFGKKNNSTDQTYLGRSKWVGLTGGAYTQFRDFLRDRDASSKTAAHINSILKKGDLKERFQHLVAKTYFEGVKQDAVLKNDKLTFKDAETQDIFEDILYLKKAGRLDLLKNALKNVEEFDDASIDDLIQQTTSYISPMNSNINELHKIKNQKEKERDALIAKAEQAKENAWKAFNSAGGHSNQNAVNAYNEFLTNTAPLLDSQIDVMNEELITLDTEIENAAAKINSPFVKSNGEVMERDEVRAELQEKASKINKIIDYIDSAQMEIDANTSEVLTDEQLATLSWYKVMMKDWKERSGDIATSLKDIFKAVLDDDTFRSEIEHLENLIDKKEYLGLAEETVSAYGGHILSLKKFHDFLKHIRSNMEAIAATDDAGGSGLKLATMLASKNKIILTDKDENKKQEEVGKYFKSLLETATKGYYELRGIDPSQALKDLEDLQKLGESYGKYNSLLEEYLKNPEKIDQAHNRIDTNNANKNAKKISNALVERFDWNAPVGSMAKVLQENREDISAMGGFDKFLQTLTPEQQTKLKQAEKLIRGVDSLKESIDNSNLEDSLKDLADKLIEDSVEEADNIQEFIGSIQGKIDEGVLTEFIESQDVAGVNEEAALNRLSEMETTLHQFFEDQLDVLEKAVEDAEKIAKMEFEQQLEKGQKASESEQKKAEQGEGIQETPEPTDKTLEEPEDKGPEGKEPEETDETDRQQANPATKRQVSQQRAKMESPMFGKVSYPNRPQLSQYYLHSHNNITYIQYIKEHPEHIPSGVDKQAYLQYIEAVHTYLKNSGAFEYVNGTDPNNRLQVGQQITFFTDPELNKAAGVTVILMKHGSQVIGSIKTDLDFNSIRKGSNKTYGEINAAQKALYDSLVSEYQQQQGKIDPNKPYDFSIQTKVESLKGGSIAFGDKENSVSDVFEGTNETITIAINTENGLTTGNKQKDTSIMQPTEGQPWQVYTLIKANNGRMLPALCYSTPLKNLTVDDWYYQEAVKALQKLADSEIEIGANKKAFTKWVLLKNLHVNFGNFVNGKFVENSKGNSSMIRLSYQNGKKTEFVTIALQDDKIPSEKAHTVLQGMIKKSPQLTTNVDINRLTDQDYVNQISKYLITNVIQGESHTINDWFTYELTNIEKEEKSKNEKDNVTERQTAPQKPNKPTQVVVVDGKEVQVTDGKVVDNEGEKVDNITADNANVVINSATDIDLGDVLDQAKQKQTKQDQKEEKPERSSKAQSLSEKISQNARGKGGVFSSQGFNNKPSFGKAKTELDENDDTDEDDDGKAMKIEVSNEKTANEHLINESIEKVKQLFPKLGETGRVNLVKGIIRMVDKNGNPIEAYGYYKDGILYISDESPNGVAFHEAFHYVVDALLSESELTEMFKAAERRYKVQDKLELEEKLAEDFRKFMNGFNDHTISGSLRRFFRRLKHIINSVTGRENYLDTLFYSIYRDKLGQRNENISQGTKTMQIDTQQKLEEELQSIKEKAIANGTFMKAPNGKPTNLNEKQWLQVRTKAFKEWFGDWETNPSEASKVVDENGEPLVVYHGTKNNWTEYDKNRFKTDQFGRGIYLSEDRSNSENYGNVKELFVNSRQPFYTGFIWENGKRTLRPQVAGYLFNHATIDKKDYIQELQKLINEEDAKLIGTELSTSDSVVISYKNPYIKYGEIVVADPNQIKSATDNIGTFSKESDDIRFMETPQSKFQRELAEYKRRKYAYDNLDQETRDYLSMRHVTKDEYSNLDDDQKEIFLSCMI